ncbi:MAG: hypothetical protein K1X50_17795 [Candidatus Promineofilum sp.]|nr:hypothetical protein [Promineifilum sp.]MCW5863768.1 hypothetical protein [Anaerolineae bacterium]
MSTLVNIHHALSNTAWLFFLILGLWGLFRAIRGQSVNANYLGAAFIGQLIFVAQAVMGGILWLGGGSAQIARPEIHLLYGVFALIFLPFIYVSVLRGDDTNRAQWVLAFTTLFLFGIALRSITTSI